MKPNVSIIILNWNGWEDTIECLESLYQIDYPNYEVIVVDNGSNDESIEMIHKYALGEIKPKSKFFEYNSDIKPIKLINLTKEESENEKCCNDIENKPSNRLILIKNNKNDGFAEGNNIGIRYAMRTLNPDYILLLNNDTVVDKKFLTELVKIGETDKSVGIIGPKTYYYDFNGKKNIINFAGGEYKTVLGNSHHIGFNEEDKYQYNLEKEVDFVEGSCLLIKKELIKKIKLFNPFLFGWEEIEWSLKAQKFNYKIYYAWRAEIWHKIGSSTGREFSYFHLYYYIRSGLIIIKENFNLFNKILFYPIFIRNILYRIISIFLKEKKLSSIFYSLQLIIKAYFDFRNINSNKGNFKSFDTDLLE